MFLNVFGQGDYLFARLDHVRHWAELWFLPDENMLANNYVIKNII